MAFKIGKIETKRYTGASYKKATNYLIQSLYGKSDTVILTPEEMTTRLDDIFKTEDKENSNVCICCPYHYDGYCHNCTHEGCEREE